MKLNTLKPALGSRRKSKRVGRGHSAGQGKTAGRGMKGQKSRSGGFSKVGFEGGQMPLQRRLPKIGFYSRGAYLKEEVRLHELSLVEKGDINLESLKNAKLISAKTKQVKIILSGKLDKVVTVDKEIKVTAGARKAIEDLGGKVDLEANDG
ncbi:MAG: 50S ribosomal protein L15 [Gammaproteobacteria bacterium TMED78]|nr:MAG: 50S ribosomal protein L15 [Gammaproteobacteria bacterium TMED78]|tara:strand:+ start:903 stop:1355 length:453 start_codon:yes stop_codon:yes gene_type:complete